MITNNFNKYGYLGQIRLPYTFGEALKVVVVALLTLVVENKEAEIPPLRTRIQTPAHTMAEFLLVLMVMDWKG